MTQPSVTICVQTRGNRCDIFQRCLKSIIRETPARHFELRLGFTQASDSFHIALGMLHRGEPLERILLPGEIERFSWNEETGQAIHCWHAQTSLTKDAMTRLFFSDVPLASDYVISLDDSSYVTDGWWQALQEPITRRIDYFGHPLWVNYLPDQMAMLKTQSWYTGVPFLHRNGQHGIQFFSGFFGIRSERLRGVSLPDGRDAWKWERYRSFGSDIVLGELARQLGWSQARHTGGVVIPNASGERNPSSNGELSARVES